MIILESACVEITGGWYMNFVVKEENVWVHRLSAICRDVFYNNQVTRKSQKDVLMQSVQIYNYSCMKRRKEENSSLYGDCKLLLSKDWFEVVRVDCSIASIPPFMIDVPSSSESIQFGAKITRMKPDDKIELREVLRPLYLPPGQHLGSRKISKVFMICNNVNRIGQTF